MAWCGFRKATCCREVPSMKRRILLCCLLCVICAGAGFGDTGVIIPSDRQSPDSSVLSIESIDVHVVIDNGHATVSLKEVFHNKTNANLEGTYALALPGDSAVSDFAVWDDLTRIPGVILERKRAGELYDQIRNQALDPGLLQSGEISESNAPGAAQHSTEFTVKVFPIPAYGYKRIEAEYRQTAPVAQLASAFIFPLKQTTGTAMPIGNLSVTIEVRSAQPIADFTSLSKSYPLVVTKRTPQIVTASFSQKDVNPTEDFEIKYDLANEKTPRVTAYRTGEAGEPGCFEASALLQAPKTPAGHGAGGRTVLALFDTSLSMQWDKLERSFQALESTLRSLDSRDSFNVLVFNSEIVAAESKPVTATSEAVAKALNFVRASKLRGGTNLEAAFKAAFAQSSGETYIVLLSDGDMTEGTIAPAKFARWFEGAWTAIPAGQRPHIYAFAIGDDADVRVMRRLAEHGGAFERVGTTEPLDFKLANFVHEIGLAPLNPVNLSISPAASARYVYSLGQGTFPRGPRVLGGRIRKASSSRIQRDNRSRGGHEQGIRAGSVARKGYGASVFARCVGKSASRCAA